MKKRNNNWLIVVKIKGCKNKHEQIWMWAERDPSESTKMPEFLFSHHLRHETRSTTTAFDRFKSFESRVENWKAFFNPFFGDGIRWRISSELFICLQTIKRGFQDIKCFSTFVGWNLLFSLSHSLSLFGGFMCYVCDLYWVDSPNVVYAGHHHNPKRIKPINMKLENDLDVADAVVVVHSLPDLFQTKHRHFASYNFVKYSGAHTHTNGDIVFGWRFIAGWMEHVDLLLNIHVHWLHSSKIQSYLHIIICI